MFCDFPDKPGGKSSPHQNPLSPAFSLNARNWIVNRPLTSWQPQIARGSLRKPCSFPGDGTMLSLPRIWMAFGVSRPHWQLAWRRFDNSGTVPNQLEVSGRRRCWHAIRCNSSEFEYHPCGAERHPGGFGDAKRVVRGPGAMASKEKILMSDLSIGGH